LSSALAGVDRLVLLGDVVELRHGPVRDALATAAPILREIAIALPSGAEVVIVPGNHDHLLLAGWFARRSRDGVPPPLGLESPVEWNDDEPLAALARCFEGAAVRVSYPGVWLREDVYATHGHYGDRHTTVPMFERLGAGAMARIMRESPAGPLCAEDYEATLAPLYAWISAVAQNGGPRLGRSSHGASAQAWRALSGSGRGRNLRRRGLVLAFPAAVAALNRAGIGPLHRDISGPELRRAALRAFGEAVTRLGISAPHVIFGHTHRAGPVAGDLAEEWRVPSGGQLVNSGSWVLEPRFMGANPASSPYRPGFAVSVEDTGPPQLANLLG
jgi:hypothetical protein